MNGDEHTVDVDAVLDGAIDLHVHPSPSPFPRRMGIAEAAVEAAAAGFSAIAVKSHHHSMVTDVQTASTILGGLPLTVLSGVALNNQVGGLNASAVELALAMGGRMVWLPTISAANHIDQQGNLRTFPTSTTTTRPERPVPVVDQNGALLPAVLEILAMIRDADAVLVCGHLAAAEIQLVIDAAVDLRLPRILVNHPNYVLGAGPDLAARWAEQGAYVEHSLSQYDLRSAFYKWDLEVLMDYVRRVGASRTILSSDLGQVGNPTPTEAFRAIVPRLAAAGVSLATIRQLVAGSAAALIS